MNSCDEYITRLANTLPEICSTKHLIEIGIYRSEQSACYARKHGLSPDYFKIPLRGVCYPKKGVIDFLEKCKHPATND